MNILGLDMSSQKSGYALFVDGTLEDYGAWEMTSGEEHDWRKRIGFMADCVSAYCERHDVDIIYVEDVPPITQNSQTIKILSALQGMLIAVARISDIDIHFVPVKTWKNSVGINITGSKENNVCKKYLKETYGNDAKFYLDKLKRLTKAYEKKLSVEYANKMFGLSLVYKSPTSKANQDDIADAICIGAFATSDSIPSIHNLNDVMRDIYDEVVGK